jgi:hypothetical protein
MYVNIHNSSVCSVIDGDIKKVSFCCGVVVVCEERERERTDEGRKSILMDGRVFNILNVYNYKHTRTHNQEIMV